MFSFFFFVYVYSFLTNVSIFLLLLLLFVLPLSTPQICDFGISRFADVTSDREMTGYVVTRYYRSPELLLEFGSYTTAVDMWSFGCIFAEMMLGNPIWQGSNSTGAFFFSCFFIYLFMIHNLIPIRL